jgi:DNA-binding response OmpR family regulator
MILVVDDNPGICRGLKRLLTMEGMEAECVSSGREALAFLARTRPDLMVLDVMMPGMDGIEVLKTVRATAGLQSLPVVMFTASGHPEQLAEVRRLGADEVVSKGTMEWSTLVARVKAHVARTGA